MGNLLTKKDNPYNYIKKIIINQASCYKCNTILTNKGICKCGNVEIYGDNVELGRIVKDTNFYSDCSLVEYSVK